MDVVIEQKIGRSKTQGKRGETAQPRDGLPLWKVERSFAEATLFRPGVKRGSSVANSFLFVAGARGDEAKSKEKQKKNKKKTKKQGYEKKTRFSTRSKKEKGKGNSLLLDLKPENETNRNIKPCSFCKNNLVFPTFQN